VTTALSNRSTCIYTVLTLHEKNHMRCVNVLLTDTWGVQSSSDRHIRCAKFIWQATEVCKVHLTGNWGVQSSPDRHTSCAKFIWQAHKLCKVHLTGRWGVQSSPDWLMWRAKLVWPHFFIWLMCVLLYNYSTTKTVLSDKQRDNYTNKTNNYKPEYFMKLTF
jgi:hypothetical protein